jgi:hypothetical protein
VAEVPEPHYFLDREGALPMYFSTVHWKRTVQGFTGYYPPAYRFARWRLFQFPAPESLSFLERFGVDTVVVRPEFAGPLPAMAGWQAVGPFAEGHRVLVRREPAGLHVPPPPPPPFGLREIPREHWRVVASTTGAPKAVDGDRDTSWTTAPVPSVGDFYRVVLAEPAVVSRVSLEIGPPYEFPTRVRLLGEPPEGDPVEIAWEEDAAYQSLLASLLHRPREARLDLDIPPTRLRGIRLRLKEPDPFLMRWSIAEIRIYAAR